VLIAATVSLMLLTLSNVIDYRSLIKRVR